MPDARMKFGEHERSVRVLSKLPKCIHNSIYVRTARGMCQFFYNMATTAWALKHVLLPLFLIEFN